MILLTVLATFVLLSWRKESPSLSFPHSLIILNCLTYCAIQGWNAKMRVFVVFLDSGSQR